MNRRNVIDLILWTAFLVVLGLILTGSNPSERPTVLAIALVCGPAFYALGLLLRRRRVN